MKLAQFIDRHMIRVFKYIRVSTDRQVTVGESLQIQDDCLNDFLKEYDNMVVVGTFIDGGYSRHSDDRNDYNEMMRRVQNDECDLIIFTRLDRWFGNLRHFLNTQVILDKHGVEWFAVQQPYYDNSSPHGRAFINNSMVYAQLEVENDGERIRNHNAGKVERGEVLSGKYPLGFKISDSHLVENEETSSIALSIFEKYDSCSSLNQTVAFMADTYGIVRTPEALKNMLVNTKYIGIFRNNNQYCPAIIPTELFHSVQRKLSKNIKSGKVNDYVFCGLIVCAECGRVMSGCQHNTKRKLASGEAVRYHYSKYRCRYGVRHQGCCNVKTVSEAVLERYLLEHIKPLLEEYVATYEIANTPVVSAAAKRKKLEGKLEKLKTLFINDIISIEELKIERDKIMSELKSLESPVEKVKDLTAVKNFLSLDFEHIYDSFSINERCQFWRSIIQEIRFDSKKDFEIIFL